MVSIYEASFKEQNGIVGKPEYRHFASSPEELLLEVVKLLVGYAWFVVVVERLQRRVFQPCPGLLAFQYALSQTTLQTHTRSASKNSCSFSPRDFLLNGFAPLLSRLQYCRKLSSTISSSFFSIFCMTRSTFGAVSGPACPTYRYIS